MNEDQHQQLTVWRGVLIVKWLRRINCDQKVYELVHMIKFGERSRFLIEKFHNIGLWNCTGIALKTLTCSILDPAAKEQKTTFMEFFFLWWCPKDWFNKVVATEIVREIHAYM